MPNSSTIETITKAEALKALDEGKRIAHRTFSPGEWIEKANEHYYRDEEGNYLEIKMFWRFRKTMWWTADWFIYQDKNI